MEAPTDTQDKDAYCEYGSELECEFIEEFGFDMGLRINPEKLHNPYAIDLIEQETGKKVELKNRRTAFYKSHQLYGIDPNYCVLINHKDIVNYRANHPDIDVIFWVYWSAETAKQWWKYGVEAQHYILKIPFRSLDEMCQESALHEYKDRVDDNRGNAKRSYVLSSLDPRFLSIPIPRRKNFCNTCAHYRFKPNSNFAKWCYLHDMLIFDISKHTCDKYSNRTRKE